MRYSPIGADDIRMYISPQASYTFNDIPLLSQWIKKTMENVSFSIVFLVQVTGFEPTRLSTLEPETSASAVPPHLHIKLKCNSSKTRRATRSLQHRLAPLANAQEHECSCFAYRLVRHTCILGFVIATCII